MFRTDYVVPADDWLRLIAVAPGKTWFDVVGKVTGDSSRAKAGDDPRATASRSSCAESIPSTGVRLCTSHVRDGGGSSCRTEHTSASCFRLPQGGCPGSTSAPRQSGRGPLLSSATAELRHGIGECLPPVGASRATPIAALHGEHNGSIHSRPPIPIERSGKCRSS